MSAGDRLASANRKTVAKVCRRLGSIVTIVRAIETRGPANDVTHGPWLAIADGKDVGMMITDVATAREQRVWGEEKKVVAAGFLADGPDIQPGDGIIVTAGNRMNSAYLVVPGGVRIDYLAGSRRVGLRTSKVEDFA